MAALDFPADATTGTIYTGTNNIIYTFNGVTWLGSSAPGPQGPQGPQGPTNIPPSGAITSVYTLTTADVGEFIEIQSGGSVVIPDITFASGDVVSVFNNTTQTNTMTCDISVAYIAGSNTDRSTVNILTRGLATVLFVNSTTAIISGTVI